MNNASASVDHVINQWGQSRVRSKHAAASLAFKLASQEPGTLVASKEKIAIELSVHQSTAQRARLLLLQIGIIYRLGRHLYVSEKAGDLSHSSGLSSASDPR
jgi:DNA-binding transcriptional regulator YhcF (GntR family)